MKLIAQITQINTVYTKHGFGMSRGYLHYGNKNCEVKLLSLSELSENEMLMSINVITKLAIPSFCDFEFIVKGNEVILGPHIGILATKKEKDLEDSVQNYKNYVYDYKSIGGSITVFSLEGVNNSSGLVSGYVYNNHYDRYEKCVVPFPRVLFKRIGTDKSWREYFDRITGGRVFNDRLMGKWQVHKLLSADKELRPHLPETILFQRPADIRKMLQIHTELYLKDIYGSQGKGIINLKKSGKWVLARIVNNDKKQVLKSDYEINEFLNTYACKNEYIAQKAIDLMTDNGSKIDFRVITVKDENGGWNVTGMIARFGTKENIVSNVSSGASAAMAYDAVKNTLGLEEKEVYLLLENMKRIAVSVGRCFDISGYRCGNLGVDLALDKNRRIWIIEVNNKDPNHTIAIDACNRDLFYNTKRHNMLYARHLCGFGKESFNEANIYEFEK